MHYSHLLVMIILLLTIRKNSEPTKLKGKDKRSYKMRGNPMYCLFYANLRVFRVKGRFEASMAHGTHAQILLVNSGNAHWSLKQNIVCFSPLSSLANRRTKRYFNIFHAIFNLYLHTFAFGNKFTIHSSDKRDEIIKLVIQFWSQKCRQI